jgi:hypothetical protein
MIDDLAKLMRPDALDEMRWAMHDISPADDHDVGDPLDLVGHAAGKSPR